MIKGTVEQLFLALKQGVTLFRFWLSSLSYLNFSKALLGTIPPGDRKIIFRTYNSNNSTKWK